MKLKKTLSDYENMYTTALFFVDWNGSNTIHIYYWTVNSTATTVSASLNKNLSVGVWAENFQYWTAMLSLCKYSKFFGGSGEMMWNIAIFSVLSLNFERFAANFSSFEKRHILFVFICHTNWRHLSNVFVIFIFRIFTLQTYLPAGKTTNILFIFLQINEIK